jgi:hypothetical protein
MKRIPWGFAVIAVLAVALLVSVPVFAAVSISVDGEKQGVYENINFPAGISVTRSGTKADIQVSGLTGAYESVTTTSANPGVGAASLLTLITGVTTDATGASADVLTLADGTAGQIKIVTLKGTAETSGLKVTPTNIVGATSDVLLSATGDVVLFAFDGTSWNLVSTTGTAE